LAPNWKKIIYSLRGTCSLVSKSEEHLLKMTSYAPTRDHLHMFNGHSIQATRVKDLSLAIYSVTKLHLHNFKGTMLDEEV